MEHLLLILYVHYIIMSAETYLGAGTIYYLSSTDKKNEEGLQSVINLPLSFDFF